MNFEQPRGFYEIQSGQGSVRVDARIVVFARVDENLPCRIRAYIVSTDVN